MFRSNNKPVIFYDQLLKCPFLVSFNLNDNLSQIHLGTRKMTKVYPETSKTGLTSFKSVLRESTQATELRNKLEENVRNIIKIVKNKIDEH